MADDHDGEKGHAHGGDDHAHAPPSYNRAFAIGIGLNVVFVVVEAFFGLLSHSTALVADAAHNLSDVLGLVLAWVASILARKKPSKRRTYGLRRTTILATLANGVLLLVAVIGVIWEAAQRVHDPQPVPRLTIMLVALVGVGVNAASALLFFKAGKGDANVRAAFLHLAADAAVSLGVVIAGAVILKTGWEWVDPVISIVISIVVLVGTWRLLKTAVNLALDAVPEHIDPDEVRSYLVRLDGVVEVHDLHVWSMSTTETALTAHVVMKCIPSDSEILRTAEKHLREKFKIHHSTIQIEVADHTPCVLAPDDAL
ncbi:cation diffusion facilitator family transporter [soil metagenome]